MVERKYLDRPNWRRVLKRRFCFKPIDDKEFKGYIAAIYIDKTREPLTKKMLGKTPTEDEVIYRSLLLRRYVHGTNRCADEYAQRYCLPRLMPGKGKTS
jgi:hypothetical protein